MKRPVAAVVALFSVWAVLAAFLVTTNGSAPPASAQAPDQAAAASAIAFIQLNADNLGLAAADVADVVVIDVVATPHLGISTVHVQQRHRGIDVFGATMNVVVDSQARPIRATGSFAPGLAKLDPTIFPRITDVQAVTAAAAHLGLQPRTAINRLVREPGVERVTEIADGGIAIENITSRLVYQPIDGDVRLAWEVEIYELDAHDWWQIRIDAQDGSELDRNNLVTKDSYTVFRDPIEAPSFGSRTVEVDPADPVASPFGWHDTDGVAGAESTFTTGNNVDAYTDTDFDNQPDPGSRPNGGIGLDFNFPLDLGLSPASNTDAAVTELFYWNNRLHDVFYAYGFDETAGNFQLNNYGRGGTGGDPVRAEAQDGGNTNNANFATPIDGFSPRMQMFIWNLSVPDRDSAFDNGIVAHEYGHGVTNRLTGGPGTVSCLSNAEQPGEGWSDYFALWMTQEPGDAGTDPRGFGTWALGQPTTGAGLRAFPYSTDQLTDPRTYDDTKTAVAPHGVGSIFAAMLWDMHWDLVDRDGFDPDLIAGTGGNNLAMQLVIDGLKLQPCAPGFVDARDAILLADQLGNGGANECLIWRAFARRGLGLSASQGTSASQVDGTEAFDVPAQCADLALSKVATPDPVIAGEDLTFAITATNNTTSALTGVTITDPLPAGVTYVPGTADCGGSFDGNDVTLVPGTIPAWGSMACHFMVTVDPGPGTGTLFVDDLESGSGAWTITHDLGVVDWSLSTAAPNSPLTSFFATEPATPTDQLLALTTPANLSAHSVLRFWHSYDTENAWDGGVVEISTDGGVVWTDLGADITANGYSGTLNVSPNPLAQQNAFTGDSGGYVQTIVDLSAYAGNTAQIRFRFGTDDTTAGNGWHVDDISITNEVSVSNTASAMSNEGPSGVAASLTTVDPPPGFLRVTTTPAVPSTISVDGGTTDAFGLDWVETPPGTYEICFSDVPGFTTAGCATTGISSGLTSAVDGAFVQRGTLDIRSSPPLPTTITVDGTPVNDWGAIVTVEPGSYQVCWGDVADYTTPTCETSVVTAGAVTTVTGPFIANPGATGPSGHGFLRVTTTPAVPSQISLDGNEMVAYGVDWMKLAPGSYTVCFSDVPGFATPACEPATITAGLTTTVDGAFAQLAEIRVLTSPPADTPVTLDGRIIDQYGFWTWLPGGVPYDICADGYTCQSVNPPAGTLTTVTLLP